MNFTIGAKDEGIKKRSEGDFIFDNLQLAIIQEDKRHGKYIGPLPLSLSQFDSRDQIRSKLGSPTRIAENLDNYYINELVWTAAFKGDKFQFLDFAAPSEGKRKYGLCP